MAFKRFEPPKARNNSRSRVHAAVMAAARLASLCLLIALGLCACEGYRAVSDAPRSRAAGTARAAPPAQLDEEADDLPEGSVRLSVLTTLAVGQQAEAEKAFVDAFEARYPAVRVKRVGVTRADAPKQIVLLASTGSLPDVFALEEADLADYTAMGLCADLGALLGADFMGGYDAQIMQRLAVDGAIRAVPLFDSPQCLIIRSDLYAAALGDAAPPATFSELTERAQALTSDTDGDGYIDRYGLALSTLNGQDGYKTFFPMLRAYGAFELRRDEAGGWVTGINAPDAVSALEAYTDFVIFKRVVPPDSLTTTLDATYQQLADGVAVMCMAGSDAIGEILRKNEALAGKLIAAPLPAARLRVTARDMRCAGINAHSEVASYAADYIRYFLSPEQFTRFAAATGHVPLRADARAAFSVQPAFVRLLSAEYDALYTPPDHPALGQVHKAVGRAWTNIMTGRYKPARAAQEAEKAIAAILAE